VENPQNLRKGDPNSPKGGRVNHTKLTQLRHIVAGCINGGNGLTSAPIGGNIWVSYQTLLGFGPSLNKEKPPIE
jgi:hypothetical protein